MKKNNIPLMRRQIDKNLEKINITHETKHPPKKGWIKIIREALGMTASQLSRRMKISPAAINKAEKNEELGNISINTMKKFAEKLECEFVYFLIPKEGSLSKTVEKKTLQYSTKINNQASHTMSLEEQSISNSEKKMQLMEIYQELLTSNSNKIWDET